jgi:hypothetical protein
MEGTKIVVEQVVFVVAAKLVEAVGDDGFFLGHDIAPDRAVRQLQFGLHRTIGIDVVAGMDEKIRAVVQHGAVGTHAAAGGIDAPALPCGIAGPDERYRTPFGGRGAEMPGMGFAREPRAKLFKPHAIENILSGRQALEQQLCGKIAIRQRVNGCGAHDSLEAFDRGALDDHARRTVGAGPHHGGIRSDVARLNPAGDPRPVRGAAEIGFCEATKSRERH